jgi:hypothetical protein
VCGQLGSYLTRQQALPLLLELSPCLLHHPLLLQLRGRRRLPPLQLKQLPLAFDVLGRLLLGGFAGLRFRAETHLQ